MDAITIYRAKYADAVRRQWKVSPGAGAAMALKLLQRARFEADKVSRPDNGAS